jgi:hypothetical protein
LPVTPEARMGDDFDYDFQFVVVSVAHLAAGLKNWWMSR